MSRLHTIRTFTGRIVRPFDLQPSDIDILDIAHHLSKQCRFAGAIAGDNTIYSVAEHAWVLKNGPVEVAPGVLYGGSITTMKRRTCLTSRARSSTIPR